MPITQSSFKRGAAETTAGRKKSRRAKITGGIHGGVALLRADTSIHKYTPGAFAGSVYPVGPVWGTREPLSRIAAVLNRTWDDENSVHERSRAAPKGAEGTKWEIRRLDE